MYRPVNTIVAPTTPMTMKSVPYDVVKDFSPVALVAKAPLAVAFSSAGCGRGCRIFPTRCTWSAAVRAMPFSIR